MGEAKGPYFTVGALERIQKTKNKNHPLAYPVQKTEPSTQFNSIHLCYILSRSENNKNPTKSGPRGPSLIYSSR